MTHLKPDYQLQDETTLRWSRLEDEPEACVVSDRMELVYINTAARELVPGEWFGKRCFEVFPTVDEACAFHCPKIRAVNESVDVVYCEEAVFLGNNFSGLDEQGALVAYAESAIAAEILCARLGRNIGAFLQVVGNGDTLDQALLEFQVHPDAFHSEWRRRVGLQ